MPVDTGSDPSWMTHTHEANLKKRWFREDWLLQHLRRSLADRHIEATEEQIEQVARDLAADWDRFLD